MNTTIHSLASASSSELGYSRSIQPFPLAVLWMGFCSNPDDPEHLRRFTEQLDVAIKEALFDGKYSGILQGREPEIRQEAFLLLLDRYLANNRELIAATKANDLLTMETQIRLSIHASLWVSRCTVLRELLKEKKRYQFFETMDDAMVGSCLHPAEQKSLWELPYEVKHTLVLLSLRKALEDKLLPPKCANTAIAMMEAELSQSKVAKQMGVTRQAICQQLKPVRSYLNSAINNQEFPLVCPTQNQKN